MKDGSYREGSDIPWSAHVVHQRANRGNRDSDFIALLQREIIGWNDTGTGHEKAAVRKTVLAEEPVGKRRQRPLDPADIRLAFEGGGAVTDDFDRDRRFGRGQCIGNYNAWAEGGTAIIDF